MYSYDASYSTLNYYLQTLESDGGLPRLSLNTQGYCHFSIGDSPEICICLMPSGEDIKLSTYVFDEEIFLTSKDLLQLLSWNFSSDFLHNSVIGYCDTTQRITLQLNLKIQQVDQTNLFNACQNFGADLIKLREKLAELSHASSSQPNIQSDKSSSSYTSISDTSHSTDQPISHGADTASEKDKSSQRDDHKFFLWV